MSLDCINHMKTCIANVNVSDPVSRSAQIRIGNCAGIYRNDLTGMLGAGEECVASALDELREAILKTTYSLVPSMDEAQDFVSEEFSLLEKPYLVLAGIGIGIVVIVAMRCLCSEKKAEPGPFGSVFS